MNNLENSLKQGVSKSVADFDSIKKILMKATTGLPFER